MMAWNPCVECIGQAIAKPSEVRAMPVKNRTISKSGIVTIERGTWSVKLSSKNTAACASAITPREYFAAHHRPPRHRRYEDDCKNPSRRSSMTEIVAKMAVNKMIITNVPGKKYCA